MVYIRSKAKDHGKGNQTLTNYSTLIDAALEANYIEEKDVTLLQEWKKDPENWGK